MEAARGMSTAFENLIGLPVSVVSARANSSSFDSMRSAILFRILKRSSPDVVDQDFFANVAASTANFTSSCVELGSNEITLPVAGFIFSI